MLKGGDAGWGQAPDPLIRSHLRDELDRLDASDPFSILRVSFEADDAAVRRAFLTLTKRYHPNRFARRDPEIRKLANEVFLRFNKAHQQIKSAPGRAQVLAKLGLGPEGQRKARDTEGREIKEGKPGERRARDTDAKPRESFGKDLITKPDLSRETLKQHAPAKSAEPPRKLRDSDPARSTAPRHDAPKTVPDLDARGIEPSGKGKQRKRRETAKQGSGRVDRETMSGRVVTRAEGEASGKAKTGPTAAGNRATPPHGTPIQPGGARPQRKTKPPPSLTRPPPIAGMSLESSGEMAARATEADTAREQAFAGAVEQLRRGDLGSALSTLKRIASERPGERKYRVYLTYARGKKAQADRQDEEAVAEFRRALALDPNFELAKKALSEMRPPNDDDKGGGPGIFKRFFGKS